MKVQRTTPSAASATRPSRDFTNRRPRGMTLVEILLVLVLLVVIASFAMPIIEGGFASVRLQRGTDQVLAAWTEIRAKSIESGQLYQFRFTEGGNSYRVDPWYADESKQPAESELDRISNSANRDLFDAGDESDEPEEWRYQAALAEQIVFVGGNQAVNNQQGERKVETLQDDESGEWSAPILFFPDGTTSEASVVLRNGHDRYQRATLRALTGVARASRMLSEQEVEENNTR